MLAPCHSPNLPHVMPSSNISLPPSLPSFPQHLCNSLLTQGPPRSLPCEALLPLSHLTQHLHKSFSLCGLPSLCPLWKACSARAKTYFLLCWLPTGKGGNQLGIWEGQIHTTLHKVTTKDLLRIALLLTRSCRTLCDPKDCGPPGSPVHGILQARILEWVAIPSSRRSFQPRDRTRISCSAGRFFHAEPLGAPTGNWIQYCVTAHGGKEVYVYG